MNIQEEIDRLNSTVIPLHIGTLLEDYNQSVLIMYMENKYPGWNSFIPSDVRKIPVSGIPQKSPFYKLLRKI